MGLETEPRPFKRFKRAVRFAAVRSLLAVIASLPVRVASALGEWFGALAYFVAGRERTKALESLGRAFPQLEESARRTLAKKTFRHLGRCAFELACVEQIDRQMEQWVEWPAADRAVLEGALARGKGVVFVSGHVGQWELLARRVALAGFPCQSIGKETTDPRMTALIGRFRSAAGLKTIWRGRGGAAKQMLRALKSGEILGLLIDQDTKVQSLFVPFFGHPAKTPRAAADLALRTGAAVVLGFCRRTPSGTYRISMEEVPLPAQGEPEERVMALTCALSAGIEAAIREAPEQWVWMHRRWKSVPTDIRGS